MTTASSSYLSSIERNHSEAINALPSNDLEALRDIIQRTRETALADLEQQLVTFKALFAYRWAIARLSNSIDDRQLGELQTEFASLSIDKALASAWRAADIAKLLPKTHQQNEETIPGLFVLGLGKLGGYDLNFSSDVDLIAFYDAEQLPIASVHGRSDVCNRVLKKMTQLLGKSVNGHNVWRVDWRLRPNASTMSLCMTTDIAEDYFFFHSLPWQRLAMIKARVVAGDIDAGNAFLTSIEPYLWRQNLDYQMIDEIHHLKKKINLEHPQLRQSRDTGSLQALDEGIGFNLKLGRGGIREIEFIANAMQLLWGGKKVELRNTTTVTTLKRLADCGLLEQANAEGLIDAYKHLRKLEDAAQIQDNLQTHIVPKEKIKLSRYLTLLGADNETAFWSTLEQHRQFVAAYFDRFFERDTESDAATTQRNLANLEHSPPSWSAELPEKQQRLLKDWANGFSCYAVAPSQREALAPLFKSITTLLSEERVNRSEAIDKLHQFFSSIPKGGQYLRLLAQHPVLLNDIAIPLIHSPHMQHLLSQSPHIVDFLLEPLSRSSDQFILDSEFVLHSKDFEVRLERLRRFVNEHLYAQFLALIQGKLSADTLQRNLTQLAEHTLDLGVTITCEELGLAQSPIAIIGMGKLGMRAMAPMSDLDLIFVVNDDIDLELANRFSQRFQHLMELRTREGRAYEMDMRLRPSGRSGPVTVSMSSFKNYHFERAKTWEHIALCAGRSVAGDRQLLDQIDAVRAEVITRPRDQSQFKLDAAKMLRRIQQQRVGKSKSSMIDIKLMPGGLMELDYMSACICLNSLRDASLVNCDYDTMMGNAFTHNHTQSDGFAVDIDGNTIAKLTQFLRHLQVWTRILGIESFANVDTQLQNALLADFNLPDSNALSKKLEQTNLIISDAVAAFQSACEAEKPDNWDDWVEEPIRWR